MKNNFKFTILFIFVLLLLGCNKSSTYEVSLQGSSNSYYNWTYEIEDPAILKVVDEKYFGQEGEDSIDGLDGVYKFEFEALVPGKTNVKFKYARAWEETDVLYEYTIENEICRFENSPVPSVSKGISIGSSDGVKKNSILFGTEF